MSSKSPPPDKPKKPLGAWTLPDQTKHYFRNQRQYKRNVERECIECVDELGTMDMPLADLPGKVLTHLMLIGLVNFLHGSESPRSKWFALKRGLIPADRRVRKAIPKLKPERALSPARRAIVETMLQYDGCRIDRDQAQTIVRGMTPGEVELWNKEPDVIRNRRALTGKRDMRLSDLLDRLQPTLK